MFLSGFHVIWCIFYRLDAFSVIACVWAQATWQAGVIFWNSATEIVCACHMWTFWLLFILSMVFSDLPLFSCGHLTHFTLHALASYASRTWNTCSAALYVWRTTIILSRSLSFRVHSTRDSSRQFRRGGEFRMHPGIAMPKNSWGPVEVFYCLYIKRMPQLAKTCLRAK